MKIKMINKRFFWTAISLIISVLLIASSFSSAAFFRNEKSRFTSIEIDGEISENFYANDEKLQNSLVYDDKSLFRLSGKVTYPEDLSDPNNTADYLIITSDIFYYPAKQDFENETLNNRLNELAHWRAEYNRFDVAVVNVNDSFIDGNNDTKIKEFVEYVYNTWSAPHMSYGRLGYLVLVGDTPFVVSHNISKPQGGYFVADRWYGCFKYNADTGCYEGDDNYRTPEIMIGRFSVDNYTELDIIAEKTIHYEQNPVPGDWHKNVTMAQGTWNPFFQYSFIKEILLEYSDYKVTEVLMPEGTAAELSKAINKGTIMVNWCGHGCRTSWEIGFGTWNIPHLTNGYKLPIIMSIACNTGRFQHPEDCLGEVFLNTPDKGAIAFYGASKGSGNSGFTYYALRSIFENFEYVVGKIINRVCRRGRR